ncbi:MAG: transcription termination factor NusA [Bacilli bacterium]|nr:transcription termination factor NusA [Bacilli bacterium]
MAMNAVEFIAALEEIEASKGISKDTILDMLKESLIKAYRKQLGGDDADVRVNIDPEKGIIDMCQVKAVVDEVEDDFLQISVQDANDADKSKKYKAGDEFVIPATIDELKKATAMSVKSMLKQKFAEAEKSILYETFKDKIGTIITGKVEKVDDRGISVNIVKTSVFLPKKELIGDEKFIVGETIKIYVDDVASGTKGAHIVVSRSKEGFLRCILAEEISEIYDGTVQIKAIAREAGERSKVAVYSKDPTIDPAGACIGSNGARIQKVVSQLGNGGINKEKIDIIGYSDNTALFIMEALKPARVVGAIVNEEEKSAIAIVNDDSFSLAIGRRGVNVRLAVKLTGYNIDVKTETMAAEEGLEYISLEEATAEENAKKAEQILLKKANEENAAQPSVLRGLPEGYVAPQDRVYEEEATADDNAELTEALENEAEKKEAVIEAAPVIETPVEEPVKEEEPAPAPAPVKEEVKEEHKEVKTTTSIEDLEKSLADESARKANKGAKKSFKKNNKKAEEETEEENKPVISTGERMSIYTEEELREMEEEEKYEDEVEDDDIDYDEFDEYYDDDGR